MRFPAKDYGEIMLKKKTALIKRETAERTLNEVIERAKEINADDSYSCGIREIRLFGSVLNTDKPMVGDLDLMVNCEFKKSTTDAEFEKRLEQERAQCNGYFIESLFYPYNRALKRLKNRSHTVSLHEISEFANTEIMTQSKQVFENKEIGSHAISVLS